MRASQRPGASSSDWVGTIGSPSHSRLSWSSPPSLRSIDAPAERDAGVVVVAVELEAEQAVDERGGLAAFEPVPAQRFVDAVVRRDHALAERLDDDVGVALEHRDEALQLLEQRPLRVRPHRAEQDRRGSESCSSAAIDDGSDGVEAAELSFERVGLHLVRADVVRRERARAARAPTAPNAARRARLRAARARSAARRSGSDHSSANASTLRTTNSSVGRARERERQVVLAERVVREQPDHRAGPHAEQHRQRAAASACRRTRRATSARRRRRCRPVARRATERAPRARRARARGRRASRATSLPVDAARRNRERGGDAGRVRDRELRGAHDVVERAGCGGDRSAGSGTGSPVSRSSVAIDVRGLRAISMFTGTRRLQHPHQLARVEAERVRETRPHLGNVAHCASLWTMVEQNGRGERSSRSRVSRGSSDSGCCRCSTPSRTSTGSSDSTCAIPARRARKLDFHRVDIARHRSRARTCAASTRSCISRPSLGPMLDEALFTRVNVDGTRRVLDAASRAGVRKVVRPSSAAVYGAWANNPVPLTEDAPLRPSPGYLPAIARRRVRTAARASGPRRTTGSGRDAAAHRAGRRRGRDVRCSRRSRLGHAAGARARRGARRCRSCTSTTPRPRSSSRSTQSTSTARYNVAADGWLTREEAAALLPAGAHARHPVRARRARARARTWASGLGDAPPSVVAVPRASVGRRERPAEERGLEAASLERRSDPPRDTARPIAAMRAVDRRRRRASRWAPRSVRGG